MYDFGEGIVSAFKALIVLSLGLILTAAALGFCVGKASAALPPGCIGAVPPCDPHQEREDIFPCPGCVIADKDGNGVANMQDLNPTTLKAKATRAIAYRVELRPGCSAGTVPSDLDAMNRHVAAAGIGLALSRNDAASDLKVKISCGLEQINKCGGVNVFCLPDGFPYNTDVYLSDVLSGWDAGSKLGIPLHEIVGHAIGTWNEQYAACGASCGFASTSGLSDYMNTGPLSRHGFTTSELNRWERTMWRLTIDCGSGDPYYDICDSSWHFSAQTCPVGDGTYECRWSPSPAPYGRWLKGDVVLWDICDPGWQGRHTPFKAGWMHVGDDIFDDAGQFRTYAPAC